MVLKYKDPRRSSRMLISIAPDMLRDAKLLARARGVSLSELVRRAMADVIADQVRSAPYTAASFRGELQG